MEPSSDAFLFLSCYGKKRLPGNLGESETSEFIQMHFEIATDGQPVGMNNSVYQMDKCVSEKDQDGITFR